MEGVVQIQLKADDMQLLTPEQAWHYRIIPKTSTSDIITFYIDEASFTQNVDEELEMIFGKRITLVKASTDLVLKALGTYYRLERTKANNSVATLNGSYDDFLMHLIAEAKKLGSCDIHIETYEERCRIRIRIDGMLVERYVLQRDEYPPLINKIKIKSNLDIAEKRLPQDGRIFFTTNENAKFDIRVSILPTLYGEKVVLRLLSNDATNIDINKLGFTSFDLNNYLEGIKRPTGILLISGPTGSGKTTTLYATLKYLNKETRNILTIEDPIEYTLEGINQAQLKESIGFNFGSALRTFLRQDPDVIMVGEIRDADTASMAIRLALTGHLVLSTIHTNSAWGTISRLVDMGIPAFLVANTLNTSVAQRLIRLLCIQCKKEEVFNTNFYPKQFVPYREVTSHFLNVGCEHCYFTGYKGRKAVYEVIPIDFELAKKIKEGQTEVTEQLNEREVKTLAENAFELFESGQTSLEEIYPLLFNF